MVMLSVVNGSIGTNISSSGSAPVHEEVGQGVVALLTEFYRGVLKCSNSVKSANAAMDEMMEVINNKVKEMQESPNQ